MALKLKGSTSGFVGLDAPATAGNNTLILPENSGSAFQIFANDITAGVTTFTQVTVSRNGDLTVPGTISIGGTLTYEDVTSVDSVGIVTARGLSIFGNTTGLNVTSGISTFTGDIFLNSTDKKIYLSSDSDQYITANTSSNYIAVATGNAERLRVDSSGRLLVGTTSANSNNKIHARLNDGSIASNSSASVILAENNGNAWITIGSGASSYGGILFADSGSADIGQVRYNHNGNILEFHTNSAERMRITSGGSLLVGQTSDDGKLCVQGAAGGVALQTTDATNSTFRISHPSSSVTLLSGGSSQHLALGTGFAEKMRIDSAGDIFIGTTSDIAPANGTNLCVSDSAVARLILEKQSTIKFGLNVSNNFVIYDETNDAARFSISSNGNVGVNNTIPDSLHSSGQNLVIGSGSGEEGMTIYSGNTSSCVINFADGTSSTDRYEGRIIYSHNNDHMTFHVADGAERMRIVNGGRLFVGTTGAININGVTTGHTFNQVDDYKWIMGLRCELTNKVGLSIRYAAGGNDHDVILFAKDSTVKFVVHSTGNVANANNSYGQSSDISLKENIVDANSQWNDIKNVKVRNFNFKAETGLPNHTQIGVVAQEIETTSPKLVTENEEGIKEVGYSVLYMKAIKALQEAMARIETLESEVAALKGS